MSSPPEQPPAARAEADWDALWRRLDTLQEYVDKALHVACNHFDTYAQRSARPYYSLDDGWALTSLDTGQPFFVNTRDRNVTPWIILGGHWETNVERVLAAFVRPGMQVLDIGAHIGYYTIKLGAAVGPEGRLIAFEPNPEVNAVCLENIKINGLANSVELRRHALGDYTGQATLTRSASNMASANLLGEQEADMSVTVDVRRLDDVLPPGFRPGLVKLDAEGYEKRILDGAARTLARSPDCAVMIELGLDRWERSASLDDLVPACGGNGRSLFAVRPDGTMDRMDLATVRPFLLGCPFHENYFLVAREEVVRAQTGELLRN